MVNFVVIAYATKNDYYESLSKNLKDSCQAFGIPLHLLMIDSLGSWEKNTHYKADFIKECLVNLEYERFVYVDVDAIFKSYPSHFDHLDCDISFRLENFPWRKSEPLSGTIFLKKSDAVLSLVDNWISINKETPSERRNPLTWEQYHLKTALDKTPGLKYENLPAEYVFITDHTRRLYPGLVPVIEHFQASRVTAIKR